MRFPSLGPGLGIACTLLILSGVAGCGRGYYPVSGVVKYHDGKPFTKGMVVFESKEGERPIMARGEVQPDGTFQLSTIKPGDGLPSGKYRVLFAPRVDIVSPTPERDRLIDKRFTEFSTSGLEYEVKPDANHFSIQVTYAGKVRR